MADSLAQCGYRYLLILIHQSNIFNEDDIKILTFPKSGDHN